MTNGYIGFCGFRTIAFSKPSKSLAANLTKRAVSRFGVWLTEQAGVKLQIHYHHDPQLAIFIAETTVRSPHSVAGVEGEPRSLKVRFDIDVTFGSGQVMLDRKGAGLTNKASA